MTTRRVLAALAALGALTAAGCGSGGSSSASSSSSAGATVPATAAGGKPAARNGDGSVAIAVQGFTFTPNSVTVKAGQKITWTVKDGSRYDVKADVGASFKSKVLGNGARYSFTPTKAGTIDYECTLHPGMVGNIIVE